jgi:adenylate kinase family enzyme
MPESELELIRIENRKMYHRKYKKAHPDPKTAVKWAKENPEKVKAYQKEYYQKNKEKIKARRNKQYKIDPEPHKKAVRKWKEKNRGLLLNNF